MVESRIVETICFARQSAEGRETCLLKVFRDGSVAVDGPDVRGIVEECSDAVGRAVSYVESKGYVRCHGS